MTTPQILLLLILLFLSSIIPNPAMAQVQLGNTVFGENEDDEIGRALAMSGDGSIIAVPSYRNNDAADGAGRVQMYTLIDDSWTMMGSTLTGEESGEFFGVSVALSGDGQRLAVGATGFDGGTINKGRVKVFEYDGTDWILLGNEFVGTEEYNLFGNSVALSAEGNRLVIGIPGDPEFAMDKGMVKIYDFDGTSWAQTGSDLVGTSPGDGFGFAVDIADDGHRIAVSAPNNDGAMEDSGQVSVYDFNGVDWALTGVPIDGENEGDHFGAFLSLSGNGERIVIGAFPDTMLGTGRTRVFEDQDSDWVQLGETLPSPVSYYSIALGISINYDGSRVALGYPIPSGVNDQPGVVKIHDYNGSWIPVELELNGDKDLDYFGNGLALSDDGNKIVISAPLNDSIADNSGQVRVYYLSTVSAEQAADIIPFDISPNPAFETLRIDNKGLRIDRIVMADASGKIYPPIQQNNGVIDLSELPAGAYWLTIYTNGKTQVKPFIKH